MRFKIRLSQIAALFISALFSLQIALAGDESVWTTVNFNIAAVDDLSVKLLLTANTYDAAYTQSTNPLTPGLEFNSSDGITAWDNPSRIGVSAAEQSDGYPIIKTKNQGTTTCEFNISISSGLDACQLMRYMETWQADPSTGADPLNTTPLIYDSSFTPNEEHDLYLWGNFTNCEDTDDTSVVLMMNISC